MSDKIENKAAAAHKEEHNWNALDLLKGAAMGAAMGAAAGHDGAAVKGAMVGGAAAAAAVHEGVALKAAAAVAAGAVAGVGAEAAAKKGHVIEGAIMGGAAGALGALAGEQLYKENKKEIDGAAKAAGQAIGKTVSDVAHHVKERPLTSAIESILCPPLMILDAKLRHK